jgi:hypothetical protein
MVWLLSLLIRISSFHKKSNGLAGYGGVLIPVPRVEEGIEFKASLGFIVHLSQTNK